MSKKTEMMVFTVYVPTNRGLKIARAYGMQCINEISEWYTKREARPMQCEEKEARGEEIPDIMRRSSKDRVVVGIMGEDILYNFYAKAGGITLMPGLNHGCEAESSTGVYRGKMLKLEEKKAYPNTIFGLPTLCLLGREGTPIKECRAKEYTQSLDASLCKIGEILRKRSGKRQIVIAVDQRYAAAAANIVQGAIGATQDRFNQFRTPQPEITIEWRTMDGKVDVTAAVDETIDYAIDVVLSGKTCQENGLGIYAKLFKSDGILVCNRKAMEINWDISTLQEEWGMQRLEAIAKKDDKLTYDAFRKLKEDARETGSSGGIH